MGIQEKDVGLTEVEGRNETIIDKVQDAKAAFMRFGGFCAIGLIVLMLGIFFTNLPVEFMIIGMLLTIGGYAIIAMPCLLAFVFKIGVFVSVGPIFQTSYSRVGNIIYKITERDHTTEMGANFLLTLFKCMIMFFVSLVLTPLVTLALYVCYKKARKEAVAYAKEHGIEEENIPRISKGLVLAVLAIVGVIFIGSIIGSALTDKQWKEEQAAENAKYAEMATKISQNLPEEYYAAAYKGGNAGGYAVEILVEGERIYCGRISYNFNNYVEGLTTSAIYYIIDDTVYLDLYSVNKFEISTDEKVKEYLLARHISQCLGEGATFVEGDNRGEYINLTLTYQGKNQIFSVTEEGELLGMQLNYQGKEGVARPENSFQIVKEHSLEEYKATALKIISGEIVVSD